MAKFFDVLSDGSVGCRNCTKCELGLNAKLVTNKMEPTGATSPVFLVLGHSTGVEDDKIGKPHTGRNGQMFRQFLKRSGIPESWVRFSNALLCANHDKEPSTKHFNFCKSYLEKDLAEHRPQAIISLGAKAFSWLTGYTGIRQFRRRGLPCTLDATIPVYPFVQPVSILQAENDADADKVQTEFISDLLWLKGKAEEGTLDSSDDVKTDYKVAETLEDVRNFLAEFENVPEICHDLETADEQLAPVFRPLPTTHIALYSFSSGPGHARAIPGRARGRATAWWWSDEEYQEVLRLLREFYARKDKKFFGWNAAKFDRKWVYVKLGILPQCDYDAEYHHYLTDENLMHDLQGSTLQYTTMAPWKPPSLDLLMKDTVELAKYGCKDVDATARCRAAMPYDERQKWLMQQLMIPLATEYLYSEVHGIAISRKNLARYGQYLDELIEKHEKGLKLLEVVKKFALAENVTLNPDAPHHVAAIMEKYLLLPKIKETEKGKTYSTDNSVLEHYLSEEFVQHIYYLRKLTKLKSTYWHAINERVQHSPIISTNVRLDNTVTGRPTSNDPNVYNQPREDTVERTGITEPEIAQAIFEARPDYDVAGNLLRRLLIKVDMSQIEIRVLASLSKDKAMIEILNSGQDMHLATAKKVLGKEKVSKGERTGAKKINFGIPYGQSERGLQGVFVAALRNFHKEEEQKKVKDALERGETYSAVPFTDADEERAKVKAAQFLELHKTTFTGVWSYLKQQEHIILRRGYQDNPFGRRRNHQSTGNRAKRQGYNFPIQSTASDLLYFSLLWSMEMIRAAGLDAKLVLTVYDSIILDTAEKDVDAVAEIVQCVMEEALRAAFDWILVPIKADVEVGENLGYMKPWKKAA